MILQEDDIHHWPRRPQCPAPHHPVLIRVDVPVHRPAARCRLREVVREVLETWSDPGASWLPVQETHCGPAWSGSIGGHGLDLSLSYAGGAGWIGLLRGGWIGVDATPIQPFDELDGVARDFLGPALQASIRRASDPAQAFALAWSDLEARLKCAKSGLEEHHRRHAAPRLRCQSCSLLVAERMAVSVAWRRAGWR